MPASRALLVIDMQNGLFKATPAPHRGESVLRTIQALVQRAHAADATVFAVRHTGPAGSPIEAGAPAWQLLDALALDPQRDRLFDKTRPSAFQGTALHALLVEAGIQELVICGMKTQYCVDTTVRVANELGLKVILAADGHTTMDSGELSAEQIVAHHNAVLAAFAQVMPGSDITF